MYIDPAVIFFHNFGVLYYKSILYCEGKLLKNKFQLYKLLHKI